MICLIQTWNKAVKIAIWCCFLAQLNGTESWNLPSGYVFLDANELHCNVELTFYCAKYNLKIAISWCFLAQMNGSESWNLHSGYVFLDWYELHRNVELNFYCAKHNQLASCNRYNFRLQSHISSSFGLYIFGLLKQCNLK